ncbi:MAG: hypothetical protein GXN93_02095 [Candidatus Diapherotrites archaeon]|nr:hypothetical protein [Candidatus Diapherotrites archaeon]
MLVLFLLAVGVVLAIATYTDIKRRIIPDWLTIGTILLFAPINAYFYGPVTLLYPLATFAAAYLLYLLGVWAGGDVKLFTAIAAVYPHNVTILGYSMPFVLSIFLAAMVVGLLFTGAVLLYRVFTDSDLRARLARGVLLAARKSFVLSAFSPVFGVFSLLVTFLPYPLDVFAAVAMLFYVPFATVIQTFLSVFAVSLVFVILAFRTSAFVSEKPVSALKDGDIPADFVLDDGTVVPFSWSTALHLSRDPRVRLTPLRAAGIYPEDIDWLRRIGVEKLRVRYSLPFVPFVLAGYVFILAMMYI